MLIDEVVITVKGGDGGSGKISFKRNAQTAKGGPDGGNGGKGGDLYLKGVNDITALNEFSYKKFITAEDGISGGKQNLYGRNGKDRVLFVPMGTEVLDLSANKVIEILNEEDKILIAKGGRGGRGNNEFKSATTQAPRFRELGEKGEVKKLKLTLKMYADIGLIGLPNAGKSSLLEVLTNAHPKIADYPFTTLEPNLGVMDKLVIADIPGLIEGASTGKGYGIKFLKHIEKTRVLVHCLEARSGDLKRDYEVIRKELSNYNLELSNKKEILLITKTDLVEEKKLKELFKKAKDLNKEVYMLSIYDTKSIEEFKEKLKTLFNF